MTPGAVTNPWLLPWMRPVAPFELPYSLWALTGLRVGLDIRPESFPTPRLPWTETILVRDLLLCVGLATSPATVPMDNAAWGFLIEHAQSLRPSSGQLRAIDAAGGWDSRVKGLFAERVGMGASAWLLWRRFNVVHLADAGPFIGRALQDPSNPYHGLGLQSLGLYGKNGGYKPDYFCLTAGFDAVVAESKGAIGPPSAVSRAERMKAKEQVRNVEPTGVGIRQDLGRLAFSTNVRLESDRVRSGADSGVEVEDPDGEENAVSVPLSADELVLHSYCKVFQFFGLGHISHAVRAGLRPLLDVDLAVELAEPIADEPVVFFSVSGGARLGLTLGICKALLVEDVHGLAERVEAIRHGSPLLLESEGYSSETLTVLPNGVVVLWGPAQIARRY